MFVRPLQNLIALAFVAVVVTGCGASNTQFLTEAVEVGDVRDATPAIGRIEASNSVEVQPAIEGAVVAVLVSPNQNVIAGQELARLDHSELTLQSQLADARLRAAEAAVFQAVAQALESDRLIRLRQPLVDQGYYSSAALESLAADHTANRAAVDRATAELEAARSERDLSRNAADQAVIRAPITGVVLAVNVVRGERVTPDAEAMFVIAEDLSHLVLVAEIAEPDLPRVTPGGSIEFTTDAYPSERMTGTLRHISRQPTIQGAMISYPAEIGIDNRDLRLSPGMIAAVEFVGVSVRRVVRIPIAALYYEPEDYTFTPSVEIVADMRARGFDPSNRDTLAGVEMGMLYLQGTRRVFVEENGRWVRRVVRVGAQSRDHVEVISGLRPGERIIVDDAPSDVRRT